ncbi:relaxase/mobilization nuclease domain-containing protein [Gluconacetobacter tumulicola]
MGPIRRASPCLHIVLGGTPFEGVWCRDRRRSQFPPRFSRHSCLFVAVSGGSAAMNAGDDNLFRPRPGRIRADTPKVGRARSFLTRVRTVTRQQQAASGGSGRLRGGGPGRSPKGEGSIASGRGVRRGRGATFVRARNLSNGWSHRRPGSRRVIVKSRSVRGAGRNGKAAAHLRYIQRDGTARDGERGRLYSGTEDRADGEAFLDRGRDDRHQFRFIVSPEDAGDLADLTDYTRDLMAQVEADLGTKLDWVAVNHHNTGHPHVHVVVNGRDELGEDLVINGDYLANGIRERASELVTLELGPVTEIEQRRKLVAEIGQDRFTRIDRAMLGEANDRFLDLRHEPDDPRVQADRTLRLRRLGKLGDMGLATEHAPGVWELSERLEPTLREMGERGDIIRTMQKALRAEGAERDPMSFAIHDAAPATQIVGRVIDKHLSDELGEELTLVVDGIDGRTHHVSGMDAVRVAEARIGSIVEIGPPDSAGRPSDRAIASMAEGGVYRPSRHLEQARFEGRVPGGDYDGFVASHVRRLEALRRAGIVERIDADQWRIPEDFATRAAAHDAGRGGRANIRVLSSFDLDRQIGADGATWLDRRLVGGAVSDLVPAGFGEQVREAMEQRRERLIEQGDAVRRPDGRVSYRRNLIATLQEREVARVGAELAATKSVPFRVVADGETVSGTFTGTAQLSSGKFAIVEKSHEFTLVPWRPVIERHLGQEVTGVVQGGSVSWNVGRQRGIEI